MYTLLPVKMDCFLSGGNSDEGKGFKMIIEALDGGRINIGAISVGLAQAAFNKALNYSKERIQFGKAISEFQGHFRVSGNTVYACRYGYRN